MATGRTYGVEIECGVPSGSGSGLRSGAWEMRGDGSLSSLGRPISMIEMVSPVLRKMDGIESVRGVTANLRNCAAVVNRTCGLHVHVSYDGYTSEKVERLDTLFEVYEMAFYGMAGRGVGQRIRGGNDGHWCKPKSVASNVDRYRALNLTNYLSTERYRRLYGDDYDHGYHPTFEIRAFGPTTNATKITGAILLGVGIVEATLNDPDFGAEQTRFSDPRAAMDALITYLAAHPAFLPIDPASEVAKAAFDRCMVQATNAATALGLA